MGLQVTPFFTLAANPSLGFSPNSPPLTRYFRHAARREKVQEAGLGGIQVAAFVLRPPGGPETLQT